MLCSVPPLFAPGIAVVRMAKGEDAVRRKRNKTTRKRARNSESAVSVRVAAIIASKRRRKSGKRRKCEGMCFSLPTIEDPFNDRLGKKTEEKPSKRKSPPLPTTEKSKKPRCDAAAKATPPVTKGSGNGGDADYGCPSKFFVLCLNSIKDAWKEQQLEFDGTLDSSLLACDWGVEFWKCCSSGSNIIDTSGCFASREQVAWVVSTASDIITRKEKQEGLIATPFLLFLVPTQEKAVQVRSACKPLKPLGLHTVSLHAGASLNHQVEGLKWCEPEFLVSTPDRLFELVSLRAIDISGVSLLVLDGLKAFIDLGLDDKIKSIREAISGNPQVILFGDCYCEASTSLAQNLLHGPITRLSQNDSVNCQGGFISQHIHFYTEKEEEEKIIKIKQIITETLDIEGPLLAKVLLVSETAEKYQTLATSLKDEGYNISEENSSRAFSIVSGRQELRVSFTDQESLHNEDVEEFNVVILANLPASIEDYTHVLTSMARHSTTGVLHSFFCEGDAPLAQPLVEVLTQCAQGVPEVLQRYL